MKPFNHKRMAQLIESCAPTGNDEKDKGMSEKTLLQIIEILEDCNCYACAQLIGGYMTAYVALKMNDIGAASRALNKIMVQQSTLMALAANSN